jgi:hypothetical protein
MLAWQGQVSSHWGKCILPTLKQTLISRVLEAGTGGTADRLQKHTGVGFRPQSCGCVPYTWDDRHVPPRPSFLCWDGVSLTFCPGWLGTTILPFSASWIARTAAMSHQVLPLEVFLWPMAIVVFTPDLHHRQSHERFFWNLDRFLSSQLWFTTVLSA